MKIIIVFLEALKAVCRHAESSGESDEISDLALAAIKKMSENAEVAVDLHSVVYMFHFSQAVIKHVSNKDAYNTYVGKNKPKLRLLQFYF